jgi:hypothetical protein
VTGSRSNASIVRGRVRRLMRNVIAVGLAALAAGSAGIPGGLGQTSRSITIKVPPSVAGEPASQFAFPILIEPADAIPRNSFVRLRGLPSMAALSEGHVIGAGSWAVPIHALRDLKISLPTGSAGRSDIAILLVAVDGTVLVETTTTLTVSAGRAAASQAKERAPPAGAAMLRAGVPVDVGAMKQEPTAPPAVVPPSVPQDREKAIRLFARGNEQLEEGNISAARLFYERAAEAGLPEAAMALAATFDAAELARLNARGIRPDGKVARQWYERARQLGARGAEERLRRLGASN